MVPRVPSPPPRVSAERSRMIHATAPQETGHVLLAGTEGAYPQMNGSILCLAPTESASFRGPKARARALKWCAERGIHPGRSEEHTSELQSRENLVCRLLLEKKKR